MSKEVFISNEQSKSILGPTLVLAMKLELVAVAFLGMILGNITTQLITAELYLCNQLQIQLIYTVSKFQNK